MKLRITTLAILFFMAAPTVQAAKSKQQPLRWYESHGEIVLDTVCNDFAYGSIDYRECRAATQHLFEERCKEYGDKADHARGERRDEYWRQEEKYCSAASRFRTVD